jgi:predicted acyl esterase
MLDRAFLQVTLISSMCVLLLANGYPQQKGKALPSAYPAEWGVIFQPTRALTEPANQFSYQTYLGFSPGTKTLAKGTVLLPGTMALPCDIIWDRDVAVKLRDGITIYVDVFRPAKAAAKLPALIAWAPYGKSLPADPVAHFNKTVPASWVSGLTRFEGPDPAFWCNHGYAVINVDTRGAFKSQGDIYHWGSVDAADGYEVVEWAARQNWCSGKIAMNGTSWLGISQWYIAALQPPHLAAISPWGAHFYDVYRWDLCRGGIPDAGFDEYITSGMTGAGNRAEAPYKMVVKYPLMHPYWEDKIADVKKIRIPVYSVGAYGRDLQGFLDVASKEKWLRIENKGEWNDQYDPVNQKDVLLFFDRYLKGIQNGWEKTPTVRLTVINPGGSDEVNRPETHWPPARTEYRKFYLDARSGKLDLKPAAKASSAKYDAETGQAVFTVTFAEETRIIGYPKLRLWVEAGGAKDMDLFVTVQKAGSKDRVPWPDGRLRVSLRELDPVLSTDFQPVHKFRRNQFLSSGQIVPVDIAILPTGLLWRAGEQLLLTVAGNKLKGTALAINKGTHIIHTGSKYESYLQLPIVPQR